MGYSRSWNEFQKLGLRSVALSGAATEYNLAINWPQTKTGSSVPGYRERIEKGLDASSYYQTDRIRVAATPITWSYDCYLNSNPSTKYREVLTGYPYPVSDLHLHLASPTAAQDAEALSRLYSRLRSERTAVNGLNVLGELRETIRMLRKPANAFVEQVRLKLRHDELTVKRIKRAPYAHRREQWSKAVSGSVLELNFGLKPLMSDIEGICEAALRTIYSRPLRKQFTTESSSSTSAVAYQALRTFNASVATNFVARETWQNKVTTTGVRYSAGSLLKEEAATSSLERLRVQSGLTFENILPTAWELTPWSFLVDYVTNIGDIIEAATTDTSDVFYCVKTVFQSTTVKQQCVMGHTLNPSLYTLTSLSGSPFYSEWVRNTLTRTPIGKPPIPKLTFTHPGGSVSKIANILSLVDQKRPSIRF